MTPIVKAIRKARDKKDVPFEPYTDAGLPTQFAHQVAELKKFSVVIAVLEKKKKKLQQELMDQLGERGRDRVLVGEDRVLAYEGKSVHIDQKKLLENGVSIGVIELSKNTAEYVTVKVYRDKKSSNEG